MNKRQRRKRYKLDWAAYLKDMEIHFLMKRLVRELNVMAGERNPYFRGWICPSHEPKPPKLR
ncbi:MAG TPA: hypothetical protein ENI27_07535 [bacterium]|nr:hypothetical protein [bacterium]